MANAQQTASNIQFDFDYYRFNGKGNQPSLVPTYDQANFIRSRQSIDESLLTLAIQRVSRWAIENRLSVSPKKPFPSSSPGKFWLESRFGGLSL